MIRMINILAAMFCLFASLVCFVSGNISSAIINFMLAALNMTLDRVHLQSENRREN